MNDSYWVVRVDRATGETSSVLVDDADQAHALAQALITGRIHAVVVGKRRDLRATQVRLTAAIDKRDPSKQEG